MRLPPTEDGLNEFAALAHLDILTTLFLLIAIYIWDTSVNMFFFQKHQVLGALGALLFVGRNVQGIELDLSDTGKINPTTPGMR